MKKVTWQVEPRQETGKSAVHKLRAKGKLPGIVYGKDLPPASISIDYQTVVELLKEPNWNQALITLDSSWNKGFQDKVFMIQEMQRHHVTRSPLALDLFAVRLDRKITIDVPLNFTGVDAIRKQGGLMEVLHRTLTVKCLPTEIPDHINVDVSNMFLGSTLHLGDITLPGGIETDLGADYPLCNSTLPRAEVNKGPEEGGAAEGAPAAEGEKPEAGKEAKKEKEEK